MLVIIRILRSVLGASIRQLNANRNDVYESPSFVKKERTMGASVNLPFVYPSIGASLAPVGCFEVALAAPSVIRAQGPVGIRARQHQHGITVAYGVLAILSFEAL
jgi:hypothetical protein